MLFDFDLVRPVQLEISVELLCRHRRYEGPVRLAGGFDAGGDVDGVSPYVTREFSRTDHACHGRPGHANSGEARIGAEIGKWDPWSITVVSQPPYRRRSPTPDEEQSPRWPQGSFASATGIPRIPPGSALAIRSKRRICAEVQVNFVS